MNQQLCILLFCRNDAPQYLFIKLIAQKMNDKFRQDIFLDVSETSPSDTFHCNSQKLLRRKPDFNCSFQKKKKIDLNNKSVFCYISPKSISENIIKGTEVNDFRKTEKLGSKPQLDNSIENSFGSMSFHKFQRNTDKFIDMKRQRNKNSIYEKVSFENQLNYNALEKDNKQLKRIIQQMKEEHIQFKRGKNDMTKDIGRLSCEIREKTLRIQEQNIIIKKYESESQKSKEVVTKKDEMIKYLQGVVQKLTKKVDEATVVKINNLKSPQSSKKQAADSCCCSCEPLKQSQTIQKLINLQSKLKYKQIQTDMLKKSLHNISQMEMELRYLKKYTRTLEDKIRLLEIRRRRNNSVISNSSSKSSQSLTFSFDASPEKGDRKRTIK